MTPTDGPRSRLRTMEQEGAYGSPWTLRVRAAVFLWDVVSAVLFRPTPKPFSAWRVLLLRLFGCRVRGKPFVSSSAVVKMPWNLTLEDRACLGPQSEVYNLAHVTLGQRCTVAQQVYLCAGTHDLSVPDLPLVVGEIVVGADVFIGARAFVLPGVTVGEGAAVGACAVVTRDVPPWTVVAGNPARHLGARRWKPHEIATDGGGITLPPGPVV